MTDFNTTDLDSVYADSTGIAEVAAEPEAKAEAQAIKAVTTAKHARFLAEAARKRAEKFRTQATQADAVAVKYDELAATLPEASTGTSVKSRPVLEVGTAVTFRFGRTTSTSQARVFDGVVKARKDGEDGKPGAYKIAVGTGFDEETFTVQPGAILLDESAEDNEADAALNAAANTDEGL